MDKAMGQRHTAWGSLFRKGKSLFRRREFPVLWLRELNRNLLELRYFSPQVPA
jgi:hypothetical protein